MFVMFTNNNNNNFLKKFIFIFILKKSIRIAFSTTKNIYIINIKKFLFMKIDIDFVIINIVLVFSYHHCRRCHHHYYYY